MDIYIPDWKCMMDLITLVVKYFDFQHADDLLLQENIRTPVGYDKLDRCFPSSKSCGQVNFFPIAPETGVVLNNSYSYNMTFNMHAICASLANSV